MGRRRREVAGDSQWIIRTQSKAGTKVEKQKARKVAWLEFL